MTNESALSNSEPPSTSSLIVACDKDLPNQHEDGIRPRKSSAQDDKTLRNSKGKDESVLNESVSLLKSSGSETVKMLKDEWDSETEDDQNLTEPQHETQRNIITCSPVDSKKDDNSSDNESSQESNNDSGNEHKSSPWGFESQDNLGETGIMNEGELRSDEESTSRVYTDSQEF